MLKPAVRVLALLAAALCLSSCAAKSPAARAGVDQEIARNVLWRYREDPAGRFRDIRVTCEEREITLEGRVADAKAAADAIQIAMSEARGGKVQSQLEVRAR